MYSVWSPFLFGLLSLAGLIFSIKSVAKLIATYTAGPQLEWAAQSPSFDFYLKEGGSYEIFVKRASVFGVIPKANSLQVTNRQTGQSIAVKRYGFLFSKRTDVSGNRIVPVAGLAILQPGSFRLLNPATDQFMETDKLVLIPKAGFQGVLMILATVLSGILLSSGSVFFILSLIRK